MPTMLAGSILSALRKLTAPAPALGSDECSDGHGLFLSGVVLDEAAAASSLYTDWERGVTGDCPSRAIQFWEQAILRLRGGTQVRPQLEMHHYPSSAAPELATFSEEGARATFTV
jgi:hypothetical protein